MSHVRRGRRLQRIAELSAVEAEISRLKSDGLRHRASHDRPAGVWILQHHLSPHTEPSSLHRNSARATLRRADQLREEGMLQLHVSSCSRLAHARPFVHDPLFHVQAFMRGSSPSTFARVEQSREVDAVLICWWAWPVDPQVSPLQKADPQLFLLVSVFR